MQGDDVFSDQGVGKEGGALLSPLISHRYGSGSDDGSRQASEAEQIPNGQRDCPMCRRMRRLWSLLSRYCDGSWGDTFITPWGVRSKLDTLLAKEASTFFFIFYFLSFHYLHRVCMEIYLPVQVVWKLLFSQPSFFTIVCRCLSCKQNRSTTYSSNYSFLAREIPSVGLFLVQIHT